MPETTTTTLAPPVTTLEGISLEGLIIDKEFDFSAVQSKVSRTLGGGLVVWEQVQSGRPLDLVGGSDFGWLTGTIIAQVKALANVPNATYTLIHNYSTYRVRFRHEEGAPVSATPLVARPNQEATDYYNNVSILLMEI